MKLPLSRGDAASYGDVASELNWVELSIVLIFSVEPCNFVTVESVSIEPPSSYLPASKVDSPLLSSMYGDHGSYSYSASSASRALPSALPL